MGIKNVFLAGDSTMCDYPADVAPRAGWGQKLGEFLKKEVVVYNDAVSGRSSKSFIHEGRLEQIAARMSAGDYLLVQFGHNDEKLDEERHTDPFTTYKSYLKRYIEAAVSKGAIPVFITPVQRRSFDEQGDLQDTHGEYPQAMKQLAEEYKVRLIDLGLKSKLLLEQLGPELSKRLFLWLEPGEHANYPGGVRDDTHFCAYGAEVIAKLVVEGLLEHGIPLVNRDAMG